MDKIKSAFASLIECLRSWFSKSTETPPSYEKPTGQSETGPTSTETGDCSNGQKTGGESNQPRNTGGRRGPKPKPSQPKPPAVLPVLICRKKTSALTWEVVLTVDKESGSFETVKQNGEQLKSSEDECPVPSLSGSLNVKLKDVKENKDIPLFKDDKPMIFKMRRKWVGDGRHVTRLATGYYIVLTPKDWTRLGLPPVECEACEDKAFYAHYFYRDRDSQGEDSDRFNESDLACNAVIELNGTRLFDESQDGDLFVGKPPCLNHKKTEISWARVGEEKSNGWGDNFEPSKNSLSEVLSGKQGHFFIRIYDSKTRMIDSTQFRYLKNLNSIQVNDKAYGKDLVLTPESTGYADTRISFVTDDTLSVSVKSISGRAVPIKEQNTSITVPPSPGADHLQCELKSDNQSVLVIVLLPRVWWMIANSITNTNTWLDKPIIMTRMEFRNRAADGQVLKVLSRCFKTVNVGFCGDESVPYSRKQRDDTIEIELSHFADYEQILQRRCADSLNITLKEKTFPLIHIPADPMPMIESFTSEPSIVSPGQETVLAWATKNSEKNSISIEPLIGAVEPKGTCIVRPTNTTAYALTLSGPGIDDLTSSLTVTVMPGPKPGGPDQLEAFILRSGMKWRKGKGFSHAELQVVGLSLLEASEKSIPIDKRRKSLHSANSDRLERYLNA